MLCALPNSSVAHSDLTHIITAIISSLNSFTSSLYEYVDHSSILPGFSFSTCLLKVATPHSHLLSTFIYVHVRICTYMCACENEYIYVCMCICTCVCMWVCVCICVCVPYHHIIFCLVFICLSMVYLVGDSIWGCQYRDSCLAWLIRQGKVWDPLQTLCDCTV